MPQPLFDFLRDLPESHAKAVYLWLHQHLPITIVDEMAELLQNHHPTLGEDRTRRRPSPASMEALYLPLLSKAYAVLEGEIVYSLRTEHLGHRITVSGGWHGSALTANIGSYFSPAAARASFRCRPIRSVPALDSRLPGACETVSHGSSS